MLEFLLKLLKICFWVRSTNYKSKGSTQLLFLRKVNSLLEKETLSNMLIIRW